MVISKNNVHSISVKQGLEIPAENIFVMPEKVLQFGTGVLLRGLPDLIISQANNKGFFNGRIVLVKTTSIAGKTEFEDQDGLYTVCIRGVENGEKLKEDHIVASVSRVLYATNEWEEVLECAANPDMQIVISNTTELGIELTKDNVHATPPQSFPCKLLAFLYRRFKIFNGDIEKGMVIIPTELINANADKLLSIVLELAHQNGLEVSFIDWLENANHFCNSLVDRIVAGKLSEEEQDCVERGLGYEDKLMIMSEHYYLWAIESSNEKVKEVLSFATADKGVILAPDIDHFWELKLRLLNGSHTFSCGLAMLAGFTTVKEAMANEVFTNYIVKLLYDAIIPSIVSENISKADAEKFTGIVLDRFRNKFIAHQWKSISVQYSVKMNMRNVPLIEEYVKRLGHSSPLMALGMAAHILFLRCELKADGLYYIQQNGQELAITDENAYIYADAWKDSNPSSVVNSILNNTTLWQTNIAGLYGFENEVTNWLQILIDKGATFAMQQVITKNILLAYEK